MGAHNAATLAVARDRVIAVRDQLRQHTADVDQQWADKLDLALDAPTGGTIKRWMSEHHDHLVDTLQATIVIAHFGQGIIEPLGDFWVPGSRMVDATRSASARLDGSIRDYAGVTTFVATDDLFVGFAKWGDSRVQMLVYSA